MTIYNLNHDFFNSIPQCPGISCDYEKSKSTDEISEVFYRFTKAPCNGRYPECNQEKERHFLVIKGTDFVQKLVKHKSNINSRANDAHWTALHQLAISAPTELINTLIENNASLTITDKSGMTALHRALLYQAPQENSEALIKGSAEQKALNIPNQSQWTALHLSAKVGNTSAAERLIESEAELNIQDKEGNTPLHLAARQGRQDIVESLINAKADVNIQNNAKQTAFDLAENNAHNGITRLLKAHNITSQENVSSSLLKSTTSTSSTSTTTA